MFGFAVPAFIRSKNFNPIVHKKIFQLPVFLISAFCGVRLWEKLVGHYLNFEDGDVAHDFKINYESRYKLFEKSSEEEAKLESKFNLQQLNSMSTTFHAQGKNKSDLGNLSLVRNLENIVFVDKDELSKVKTVLELQLLIDSVEPKVKALSADEKLKRMQSGLYDYKLFIESSKLLNSDKEKLLGLPFMMLRHQQFPEPERGTWQYSLFEELYGHPYEYGKFEVETEEKIHKYNYQQFLHPSIIEKFGDNPEHPDFEYFLKQKNLEYKTRLEKAKEKREFFCKNILPQLNLLKCEQLGRDFAYYALNKLDSIIPIKSHYYKSYSGQEEEKLFREAEELRLINKNPYIVSEVELSTIKDEYKGIRKQELRELLINPLKRFETEKALRGKFITHTPKTKWEIYERDRNRLGLIDTAIEEGIDLNNPEQNNYANLFSKTYDNPDLTEDEDAALSVKNGNDPNLNSFPLGVRNSSSLAVSRSIDFNDYAADDSIGTLSTKTLRYEYKQKEEEAKLIKEFTRKYAHPSFKEKECFIVPHLERNNEDVADKIFKRKPLESFKDRLSLYKNEISDIQSFINHRITQDTSKISDDITENEINQAIFQAHYQKPLESTDTYKNLNKRNYTEIESLFKTLKITPDELWNDEDSKKSNYYF